MLLPLKYLQCFRFGRGLKKFCHDLSIIVRCFLVDKAILGFKRAHWWRKSYCLNKLAVFFLERVVFFTKITFLEKKKKKQLFIPKLFLISQTQVFYLSLSFLSFCFQNFRAYQIVLLPNTLLISKPFIHNQLHL